ncbi:MAG: beta-lactamase family protein [Chitinispirillaceae bacterium]|nr:beta-lactamase family protein [Chitinispirillaceae bacterium]
MAILVVFVILIFTGCATDSAATPFALIAEPEVTVLNPEDSRTIQVALPGSLQGTDPLNSTEIDTLSQLSAEEYRLMGVHGLQCAILSPARGRWFANYGFQDPEKSVPITDNTRFHYASCGKMFTAAIILHLAREGSIALNVPVAGWFPSCKIPDTVTIDHLLRHTSGIVTSELVPANLGTRAESASANDIVKNVFTHHPDLLFEPGRGYHYSNTGYIMLGIIAESVSGKSMAELFSELFVAPLALTNTFYLNGSEAPEYCGQSYDADGNLLRRAEHPIGPHAAGSVVSTPGEFIIMFSALLNGEILGPETTALLFKDMACIDAGVNHRVYYGRGISIIRVTKAGHEADYVGHKGLIPFIRSAVFYCPEKNSFLSLVTNQQTESLDPLMFRLFESLPR